MELTSLAGIGQSLPAMSAQFVPSRRRLEGGRQSRGLEPVLPEDRRVPLLFGHLIPKFTVGSLGRALASRRHTLEIEN